MPITRATVDQIGARLADLTNQGKIHGGTVTDIDIISPTAPAVGELGKGKPAVPGPTKIDCGTVKCVYWGDAAPAGANGSAEAAVANLLPKGFSGNDDFANTVSCRMSLQVNTMMSGSQHVTVAVSWGLRQLGALYPQPGYAATPVLSNPRGQNGGGVIIGIDASTTTNSTIAEERLPAANPDLRANSPLRVYVAGAGFGYRGFSGARPAVSPLVGSMAFPDGTTQLERNHACMPRFVALRNRFLAGIVGRMRGWGRDKLAIYSVNPVHRIARNQTDGSLEASPSIPNPPTIMVQGGTDIMLSQYDLPYVRYQVASGLELDPFISNPQPGLAATDRIILGSLRDCYHMYSGADSLGGIDRVIDPTLQNLGYESDDVRASSFDHSLAPIYYPSFGTYPWDQTIGGAGSGGQKKLTAEQIVATLGTVQICPHGTNGGNTALGPTCDGTGGKPPRQVDLSRPTDDLRGDIRGFLMAVNGAYVQPNGVTVPFPAYYATDLPGTGPTAPIFTHTASVLLVLHRRIGSAEIAGIRQQVDIFNQGVTAGALPGRRIVVAYFPTHNQDAFGVPITNLKQAFNVPTNNFYPPESQNVLMVFSPAPPNPSGINGMNVLGTYWGDRLKQGPGSVSDSSRAAFELLFTEIPKF